VGYPYGNGYGYGYGYPYYGAYPYGYGYYTPRTTVYATNGINDDATVAAVQRRLARGGYYHGSIDGVIGAGTRTAIRAFERNNGLPVDGVIDPQLLRRMGLA
jgi:peptidoglycan hydrolase-like protein with peptidoglycan-binding domain